MLSISARAEPTGDPACTHKPCTCLKSAAVRSADEAALETRFEAHVGEGGFIEAKDWMPAHYRKTLLRQLSGCFAYFLDHCFPRQQRLSLFAQFFDFLDLFV